MAPRLFGRRLISPSYSEVNRLCAIHLSSQAYSLTLHRQTVADRKGFSQAPRLCYLPSRQEKQLGFSTHGEGFRVSRTLEVSRRSHIKVETGGVECVPGCLAPARSCPAALYNPYCICSLRLLRAQARPSRLGWTCHRLPAAALACAETLRSQDSAGRRTLGALTGCRQGPAASPGPPQPCAVPRDPDSPKAGSGDAALHVQPADWTPRTP